MHDKPPLACSQHDHGHCISDALSEARQICAKRGVRLTELRAQVLEFIWQSHKPLGAYTLMEMLAQASTRRVAVAVKAPIGTPGKRRRSRFSRR